MNNQENNMGKCKEFCEKYSLECFCCAVCHGGKIHNDIPLPIVETKQGNWEVCCVVREFFYDTHKS